MKLLGIDEKKSWIKLKLDHEEDLYYLRELIDPKDLVIGIAFRKIKLDSGKQITKKAKVELEVDHLILENKRLRIIGKIIHASDDDFPKASQSINISVGDVLEIKKNEFTGYHKHILHRAQSTKDFKILVVCFDYDDFAYYELTPNNYSLLNKENVSSGKQYCSENRQNWLKKVFSIFSTFSNNMPYDSIIIASNSILLNYAKNFIEENFQTLKNKIIFSTISSPENCIKELLSRPELKTALKNIEINQHYNYVNKFLVKLHKNEKVAYGFDDVKRNLEYGNVDVLLITSKFIDNYKENGEFSKIIELFKLVDNTNAKFVILDSNYEPGRIIDNFSGITAIKRY